MNLERGTRLAHYEIVELIGKGGMGQVYRAKDTRLPREVAIKTSGARFSERFAREARVIASLNHPNICTLFDVGPDYLVMELVEGPTLAERIQQGAVPLREAAHLAQQVAEALEYAHEKGVVHRDLKPGNVKIRADGLVKVLDFGLAKMAVSSGSEADEDATVTMGLTQAGTVLGTAAYMSPEQAQGKPADRRSDVWAFGAVFYEMVAGVRPFRRKTVAETLASVLNDEPDLALVPGEAHRLLRRCLEKDPNRRWGHAGNVMELLESASGPQPVAARSSGWLWPAVACASLAVAGAALWALTRPSVEPESTVRFEVGPAPGTTLLASSMLAVSPDGQSMVFPAMGQDKRTHHWIRSMDSVGLRPVGAEISGQPGWSFDSQWIVFGVQDKLKKIDTRGGLPETIADSLPGGAGLAGVSENADGILLVGCEPIVATPILRVPFSGGTLAPVTAFAPGDQFHVFPQYLPDGRHFLYERVNADPAKSGIYIGSVDAAPEEQSTERLLSAQGQALYAARPGSSRGDLVFLRGTTLMSQPFDPESQELSGEAVAIADNVDSAPSKIYGMFSVSGTGTLAFREGGGSSQTVITWYDSSGNITGTLGNPAEYVNPAIAPGGQRVAVAVGPPRDRDIWILDVNDGASTRFTFNKGYDDNPVWSPDGQRIAYSSTRERNELLIKPADGSGSESLLLASPEEKHGYHWTRDGRFLLFESAATPKPPDLFAAALGVGAPIGLLRTEFSERMPRVSPDGRWLAYVSYETGTAEVYVRPFAPGTGADGGAKWMVSNGLAVHPRWARDGKSLYYIRAGGQVTVVDLDTTRGFRVAGTPRAVFTGVPPTLVTGWDLSDDGKRFLFVTPPRTLSSAPFTVVLNWARGLKN